MRGTEFIGIEKMEIETGLECKFTRLGTQELSVTDEFCIEGYASLFGDVDRGGDIVTAGAYSASLNKLEAEGRQVKMLWQHDPAQPIGIWKEVREDARGLYVKGQLLENVARAREAAELIRAGAIDGLSIGYRTVRAMKNDKGQRLLTELDLWEVSLVTFPMLPSARVGAKATDLMERSLRELAAALQAARQEMARMR